MRKFVANRLRSFVVSRLAHLIVIAGVAFAGVFTGGAAAAAATFLFVFLLALVLAVMGAKRR